MAVGASIRCLPLLFPAFQSSFTACCHAGRDFQQVSEVNFRILYQRYRWSNCHGSPHTDFSGLVSSPCKSSFVSFQVEDTCPGKDSSNLHRADVQRTWGEALTVRGDVKSGSPTQSSESESGNLTKRCGEERSPQVGVSFLLGTIVESVDGGDLEKVESDIRILVYIYAGFSIVVTVLILAYFPRWFFNFHWTGLFQHFVSSEPPNPPSNSATQERSSFTNGFK